MTRLLVATTNPGKLAEITSLLAGLPVAIVSLAAFPDLAEPEETGSTFAENARQKALYYAAATGLPTVAEDSGLAIDALDGAPGVQSARYPGATYPEKFARLFAALDARGVTDSPARFVCALALVEDGLVVFEATGTVEGTTTRVPRGTGGFGYDPMFFHDGLGKTLAEVTAGDKAAVSHRGQAFRQLARFLAERG